METWQCSHPCPVGIDVRMTQWESKKKRESEWARERASESYRLSFTVVRGHAKTTTNQHQEIMASSCLWEQREKHFALGLTERRNQILLSLLNPRSVFFSHDSWFILPCPWLGWTFKKTNLQVSQNSKTSTELLCKCNHGLAGVRNRRSVQIVQSVPLYVLYHRRDG